MLSIISFSEKGIRLSENLAAQLDRSLDDGYSYAIYTKCSKYDPQNSRIRYVDERLYDWVGEQFRQKNGLLFIGAVGIAVRAVAPHVNSKLEDSPVLVIDEKAAFVIPILSGHMGGANALAIEIAKLIDAMPVISTATDINSKFAIDLFAKRNGKLNSFRKSI